ncbi:MAG TPA: hypothetical protein VMV10_29625 [Pirellulales bacterium]|nr:hypothetical protein [Pirellulales bacterium]
MTANFSIGLFVFAAYLVALLPLIAGAAIGGVAGLVVGATITAALWVLIGLAAAALNAIVLAAAYLYASEGAVPQQFDASLLRDAFTSK